MAKVGAVYANWASVGRSAGRPAVGGPIDEALLTMKLGPRESCHCRFFCLALILHLLYCKKPEAA